MGKKKTKKVVKAVKKTLFQVFLAWVQGLVNKNQKDGGGMEYTDDVK